MSISPRVSVALPVCNEAEVVPSLLARLRRVVDALPGGPHEIVFVDDGSTDGTFEVLEKAAQDDSRIVLVSLSRNFGHQTAITAALDHVSGDVVVVMDADLQDPPEAIPLFLEKHADGFDVVYARRTSRKEPAWLRACYYLFYRLLARLTNVDLPLDAGDFGLMSRRVTDQLRAIPERHRYLRGLRAWAGFRQIGIPVERERRFAGKSKYSIKRLAALAFDGVFAFSVVPLRLASILGLLAVAASSLFAAYAVYARLFLDRSPQGFTAILLAVTFLSGVNLVFLGVLGEYLGRVYEEVKRRPLYIVAKVIRTR
ncbi:MAG: glycosyltransferase family 2 protein [Gammaproteobacteria bacterium]